MRSFLYVHWQQREADKNTTRCLVGHGPSEKESKTATFASGFTGEACPQDSAHEPRGRSAGAKPNLQLGELRPFGHKGVCGTRWDGFKGAAGKAFLSHLKSQWSEGWEKVSHSYPQEGGLNLV